MSRKLTQEEFIAKAKEKHGDKYDYSKVEYINSTTKICIICPKHGEFWQVPNYHLCGSGCPQCAKEKQIQKQTHTTEEFIQMAKQIHGDKYDYSKVEYIGNKTKVCIICPIHGEFWQPPSDHLQGRGCAKCGGTNKLDSKTFINKAIQVHGDKYDYSKVVYINARTKVCIICPEHGEFWQIPNNHLQGTNCPFCGSETIADKIRHSKDEFIKSAQEVHGNKYDYSKVQYVKSKAKVCIVCPEHGEFWVRPNDHLTNKSGCPKCNSSHMEEEIRKSLFLNDFKFEEQKQFDWMGQLRLDFYLPKYNIAIECQGTQHFEPSTYFGGYESWLRSKERDERKRHLCEEHGIKILYYANYDYDFPYEVITDKEKLLTCIINTKNLED